MFTVQKGKLDECYFDCLNGTRDTRATLTVNFLQKTVFQGK